MRIVQSHCRRRLVLVLELFYSQFEPSDVLAHELRPGLALAIVILAEIALLGTLALLTCWFGAVTPLWEKNMSDEGRLKGREDRDHLPLSIWRG